MASGRMAGETIVEAKANGDLSAQALAAYERRVRESFVGKDLKQSQRLPEFLASQDPKQLFDGLIGALNEAACRFFTVDSRPKAQTHKEIMQDLIQAAGGPGGLLRLAWRGWRAING